MADNQVHRSYAIERSLDDRLKKRIPKYGDRSKVIRELLKMFVDGKVVISLPGRTI